MGNPFDPMNIILLVFAVVAFIRIRATLGKRTGNEDPLDNKNIFNQREIEILIILRKPKILSHILKKKY